MKPKSKNRITAKILEYKVPPVDDVLVLGKTAAIGSVAMKRALGLLVAQPYEHITVEDEIISDILVREVLLKRLKKQILIDFILTHVKPLMSENEILHLSLEVETEIEVSEL